MSHFSNIFDPEALRAEERALLKPPGRPSGPVLMGDICASAGERPLLLTLWQQWQSDERGD